MIDWNNIATEWLSDYAAMGVFVVDKGLKIRFWNRWMALHTGKSALHNLPGDRDPGKCPILRGSAFRKIFHPVPTVSRLFNSHAR